jgi:hypothetical protein
MKSDLDVKITAGFGIAMFLAVGLLKGPKFSAEIFDAATKAVSLTVLARMLFVRWVWKWLPFLERFHGVPNLEGSWKGTFESTFVPAAGGPASTGAVEVKIKQPDIFRLKLTQKTTESMSYSYGEVFETLDDGSVFLNFSFQNVPDATLRGHSPISFGSARYRLEGAGSSVLVGNYWTDRQSTGKMTLQKV